MDWFHFDPDRLNGKRHWGAYPSPEEQQAIQREGSYKAIGYQGWWNLPALPKFNTQTPAVREFIFNVAEYWIKFGIDGWRLDVPGEIDDDFSGVSSADALNPLTPKPISLARFGMTPAAGSRAINSMPV